MISRSNRCFIAVLYHVAPTFAVIISLRKPTPAEPIHGDSFHQPSLLRYEVHRNLCSREFLAHLEKWEWTEGQAGVPEVLQAACRFPSSFSLRVVLVRQIARYFPC